MKSPEEEKAFALRAIAKYVRSNLHIVGNNGPQVLTLKATEQRRQQLETLASELDALARDVDQRRGTYEKFEAIHRELQRAGATPPQELTSTVARAFH